MERRTRKHEVHLRLNDEEYKALERNRAKCKLPQQTYLRKLVMNVQPIEHPRLNSSRFYGISDKSILA